MIGRLVPLSFSSPQHARRAHYAYISGLAMGLALMVSGIHEGRYLQAMGGFVAAYIFLTAWDLAKPSAKHLYERLLVALQRANRPDLLEQVRYWEAETGFLSLKQLKHLQSQISESTTRS